MVHRGGIKIRKRIEDRCLQEGGVTCALAVQDKAVLVVRHASHSQAARRNEYARHSSESDVCVAQSRYFNLSQPLLYVDVLSRDMFMLFIVWRNTVLEYLGVDSSV